MLSRFEFQFPHQIQRLKITELEAEGHKVVFLEQISIKISYLISACQSDSKNMTGR